jgi:hypothetical protein
VSAYHTVVPLTNVELPEDAAIKLGGRVVLRPTPAWVKEDVMLKRLDEHDREGVQESTHALVATYEAAALGDPDPEWKGDKPKSKQDSTADQCVLANLALWLSRPSPVHFRVVLHGPELDGRPVVQHITSHEPLLCHPNDVGSRVRIEDLDLVSVLHATLLTVEPGAVFTALRAAWSALTTNMEPIRYALLWIVLEALFGPEDAREITYRLSQRVALFLEADRAAARVLFGVAKKGYSVRSQVVHGRWKDHPENTARVADVENLVRRSLVRILSDRSTLAKFTGKTREAFLDDLVF